jgi:hypothetical protein
VKKYKDGIFCVQVKNKQCVVNFIMRLIPWKSPRGSETAIMLGPVTFDAAFNYFK